MSLLYFIQPKLADVIAIRHGETDRTNWKEFMTVDDC
jgi:hypothetical protein